MVGYGDMKSDDAADLWRGAAAKSVLVWLLVACGVSLFLSRTKSLGTIRDRVSVRALLQSVHHQYT